MVLHAGDVLDALGDGLVEAGCLGLRVCGIAGPQVVVVLGVDAPPEEHPRGLRVRFSSLPRQQERLLDGVDVFDGLVYCVAEAGLNELFIPDGGAVHDHTVRPASIWSEHRLRLRVGGEEASREVAALCVPSALVEPELRAVVEQPLAERLLDGGDDRWWGHCRRVVHLPYHGGHRAAMRLDLLLDPSHVRHEPHAE